jgi:hypothetical protein
MSHVSILFRSDLFASLIIAGGTGHFLKDQATKPAMILPCRPDCWSCAMQEATSRMTDRHGSKTSKIRISLYPG